MVEFLLIMTSEADPSKSQMGPFICQTRATLRSCDANLSPIKICLRESKNLPLHGGVHILVH